MRVKYGWDSQYPTPNYWNSRTPLHLGMPRFFLLYQDLNDKKLRILFKKLTGRILDAGCGDGRFTDYADVSLDFSKGMLERAKSRHRDRIFVRASISHLPFRDKAFSAAFTVDVLLHIRPEKREATLKETERVAAHSYNFLGEHRTVVPYILESLKVIPLKSLWRIIPYIAVFFAFPLDRIRSLKIDSPSQVLRKLQF